MSKIWEFIKQIFSELDPVIELFIYLGIAKLISYLFGITYIQGVVIVYTYFVLSLLRIVAEMFKERPR